MCLLGSTPDEWVLIHVWEAAKVAHREAFDELVQPVGNAGSTDDQSISEEGLKNIWPSEGRTGLVALTYANYTVTAS